MDEKGSNGGIGSLVSTILPSKRATNIYQAPKHGFQIHNLTSQKEMGPKTIIDIVIGCN